MLLLMVADLATTVYLARKQRLELIEPSGGSVLSTTPADPMRRYDTLKEDKEGLDILILPDIDDLYFFYYAPPSVVAHLYFGAPPNDLFLAAYERLAIGAHINLKATAFAPFLSSHPRFLLYEGRTTLHPKAFQALASGGYALKSVRDDASGMVLECAR
jgi:hypothetical protein